MGFESVKALRGWKRVGWYATMKAVGVSRASVTTAGVRLRGVRWKRRRGNVPRTQW